MKKGMSKSIGQTPRDALGCFCVFLFGEGGEGGCGLFEVKFGGGVDLGKEGGKVEVSMQLKSP